MSLTAYGTYFVYMHSLLAIFFFGKIPQFLYFSDVITTTKAKKIIAIKQYTKYITETEFLYRIILIKFHSKVFNGMKNRYCAVERSAKEGLFKFHFYRL